MHPLPKLRQDLVISKYPQGGQTIFVVKDPRTNRFFRFVSFQYYVATHLDGRTTLETIRKSLADQFGKPISLESVEAFVERLYHSGLLEVSAAPGDEHDVPHIPEQKSLLYYKIPFVNPARFFDTLYPWMSFCFSRGFLIFSLVWMALAVIAVATDWEACVRQFETLVYIEPVDLIFIYLAMLLIFTIHETSHGLAVHHYKGVVQDAGVLFMYFQLCFYADVSDSYLFPRKKSRMVVMLAGMYSGAFIAATAALVWRVTDPSTAFYHFSFIIMCLVALNLVFNLNPLIKLDAYYILNDWVDIPNLRRKAFDHVKSTVQRVLGVGTTARRLPISFRERFIYILYGVTASAYSGFLLWYIVNFAKDFAIEYSPELALFGLLAGTVTALNRSTKISESDMTSEQALQIEKKERKISLRFFVWTGILCLILLGLMFIEMELRISTPFQLHPVEHAIVRARIEGQLDKLYVDEGDTVRIGQIIAQLSTRDIDARQRNVEAQIMQARAEFALLENGVRPEEIEHARAALYEAETGLEAAQKAFDRASALAQKDVISAEELDAAGTDLALKNAAVQQARSRLDVIKLGSRREEIDAKRAEIQGLNTTIEYLEEQRRLCTITSPMTGIVTTRHLKERRNEFVGVGDPVCELMDHRIMIVEMAVPEREVGDVQVGFPVRLKVQGYPSESFSGVVISVAPIATSDHNGQSVMIVESEMENHAGILKSGMTGIARIYCGERPIGALMSRRIVRYIRTEFWW